jgi:hypothetical protein
MANSNIALRVVPTSNVGHPANTMVPPIPAPTVRIPSAAELQLRRALRIGNTHTYSMAQLLGIYPT